MEKAESDKQYLGKIKEAELPTELKGKSKLEITKIVYEKTNERTKLQK